MVKVNFYKVIVMARTNGRPVFETLAFKDQHERTQKALEFFRRETITGGDYLLPVKMETDKIKDISVEMDSKVIPALSFPVFLGEEEGVLIDGRSYRGNDNTIRNTEEISNLSIQATIEYYWNTDIGRFNGVSKTTSAIYGSWISNAMRMRLGLDFNQQAVVRCVFAFYYWLRFKSEDEMTRVNEDDLEHGFYSIAAGQFKLSREIIDDIYQSEGMKEIVTHVLQTKNEYNYDLIKFVCHSLPKCLNIPTLNTFDYAAVYNIVSGKTWAGKSAVQFTLGALEHPPLLMTMIAISEIKKSFYQKTMIGQVVKALKVIRISGGDITRVVKDSLIDIQE